MDITWDKFAGNNADKTNSFQALTSYIFCHQTGAQLENVPKSYPGLESKPAKGSDGKIYGFQSKLFDVQDAKTQRQQLNDAIKAVKDEDIKSLDVLKIYVSETVDGVQATTEQNWKQRVEAVSKGKEIPIEWFTGINSFQGELEDPFYQSIRAYFFGGGNPLKVQSDNVPKDSISDLFEQPYYIALPLASENKSISFETLAEDITSQSILIKARAGAGKTILLQEFAYIAGRLKGDKKGQMKNIISKGLYLRFSASEFIAANARDVLARRLGSYDIKIGDYPIRLLIDSLDEISERESRVLSQGLKHQLSVGTIQQVVSCSREASKNAQIFTQILKPRSVRIERLDDGRITDYFKKRGDADKEAIIEQAIKDKVNIDALRDVRMLELAWEVVKSPEDLQKAVLLEKRFITEAENAGLEDLNLLQPKIKKVEDILEYQGFMLERKGIYDFSLNNLQRIIELKNRKLSYNDINKTVEKVKDICIDEVSGAANILQFEHRSWADFFAAKYLTKRFQSNKELLVEFAPYEDFLKEWFVPVARTYYQHRDDLIGAVSVGVIENYLDGYLDRSNSEDELLIKVRISKHHQQLKEQLEAELSDITDRSKKSPSFALICLDCGYADIAAKIHAQLIEGLETRDKDINQMVWTDLANFYKLQLHFGTQPAESILERSQAVIYDNPRRGRGWASDKEELADKLSAILLLLHSNGMSLSDIIGKMRKSLHYLLFNFFTEPVIARELFEDDTLKKTVLNFYKGNTEDRVAMQGLLGEEFSKKQKEHAKKHLDKMREESWRRDTHPYVFQLKVYAFKRILGYSEWENDGYEHDHNDILSSENVFERIFYFSVMKFGTDDFSPFCKWLEDAPIYNRTLGARYEFPIKRASTHLIAYLLESLPFTSAQKLLKNVRETGKDIISPYNLAIQLHASDEDRFRNLYEYDDVFRLIDASKDSLEDYLSSISDLGALLAIFEPEKAMTLLYELQRETRLRYGYHKDGFGFFLTDALELMWQQKLFNYDELVDRTKKIFDLILAIKNVTDGDEVGWLPDYFFEALVKYDMKLSEQLYKKYREIESYDVNIHTILLLARIERGDDYKEIKRIIEQHQPYRMEPNRILETYYEHRFIAFMAVVDQISKYSDEDRLNALKSACDELKKLLGQSEEKWPYHPSDHDKKLAKAIEDYGKYVAEFNLKDAPSYPPEHTSADPLGTTEYKQKQQKELENTQKMLADANDRESIEKILGGLTWKVNIAVDSDYLLSEKPELFIKKLHEYGVPFSEMIDLTARALEPFYYSKRSRTFIYELWKSPYREDFRAFLMRSIHGTDLIMMLHAFMQEEEFDTAKELIDEVLALIDLLTRPRH